MISSVTFTVIARLVFLTCSPQTSDTAITTAHDDWILHADMTLQESGIRKSNGKGGIQCSYILPTLNGLLLPPLQETKPRSPTSTNQIMTST